MNQSESDYLLQIQSGTHPSQTMLQKKSDVIVSARSGCASAISGASSARMTHAISELHDFNSSLRDELRQLKGYLTETNQRLENVATRRSTHRTTARSRSSMASGSRRGVTNRSHATQHTALSASYYEDDEEEEAGKKRMSTPVKEWMQQ